MEIFDFSFFHSFFPLFYSVLLSLNEKFFFSFSLLDARQIITRSNFGEYARSGNREDGEGWGGEGKGKKKNIKSQST